MILNRQNHVTLDLPALRLYVRRLGGVLRLGRRDFNVCFVDDRAIRRLNATYRRKPQPTDVLSFPWTRGRNGKNGSRPDEFRNFLGDVVISTDTARRNARAEGHSTLNELRWLILHGLLHLLGYDHASDSGEMSRLEYRLRDRMGFEQTARRHPKMTTGAR